MKIKIVNPDTPELNDFLSLPKKLYTEEENMDDPQLLKKLVMGTHVLSSYFDFTAFICYDDKSNSVARFAITSYQDDTTAYLGFFEIVNDDEIAKYVFGFISNWTKARCFVKIVGPVNASFWLGYRLKVNMFDKLPYTGEPYNKDYYYKLFLDNGFNVCEHYTSNIYSSVEDEYENRVFKTIYDSFINKGYIIKSPSPSEFKKTIEEIYSLITTLYSDFPVFKDIEKEDFLEIFKSFKSIINYSMVKMGYYDNKPVGFFISIPNYHNIVYHLTVKNLMKINKIKKNPDEYVMLYMGVLPEHRGLGSALAQSIIQELKASKLPSIGALARDGKVTQNYAKEKIENKYEYVLLEKIIKEKRNEPDNNLGQRT